MRPMTSLELDDEEQHDFMPAAMEDRSDFPYGMRICLTHVEVSKLGIDPADATKDAVFHFEASARIISASHGVTDGAAHCRIEAQIENMHILSADEEE